MTTSNWPESGEEFPEIPRLGGLWPWLLAGLVLALWGLYLILTPGRPEPHRAPASPGPAAPLPAPPSPLASPTGSHVLKLAFVDSSNSTFAFAAETIARRVSELTRGSLQIVVLPGGVVPGSTAGDKKLGELELVREIDKGTISMAMATTSPLSNLNPSFDVLDLPFLIGSYEQADRVLDGEIGQQLFAGLEPANLKGLAYMEIGFRLFSSSQPMPRLADFKGRKVRVLQSPNCIRMARAFGAEAVPSPVEKIYEMAKQGFIDAADRTYPTYWDFRLYEVQRYITETHHLYSTKALVMDRRLFESLTPEEQKALLTACAEVGLAQRARQREEEKKVKDLCLSNGITVFVPTEQERNEFVSACQPMFDEYRRMRDPALLDRIQGMKP